MGRKIIMLGEMLSHDHLLAFQNLQIENGNFTQIRKPTTSIIGEYAIITTNKQILIHKIIERTVCIENEYLSKCLGYDTTELNCL